MEACARVATAMVVLGLVAGGCSSPGGDDATPSLPRSSAPSTSDTPSPPAESSAAAGEEPGGKLRPAEFDQVRAFAVVRHLARRVGPRHATSPAFSEAASWVAGELDRLGYDVRRQRVEVPAGESWGVPVPAGTSVNVIGTPDGFDPQRPHLVVGAHLDTVPQAPGAEDNGSGVGVLLAAAEAVAGTRTRLPVVWVAFGAEEPRGAGDDDHHYGSRAYVAAMSGRERQAMRGMVSLDRVGVGAAVPIGSARESDPVERALMGAARRVGARAFADSFQRSSDHWSFVRAGLPGARLGSTPYAGYHSAADVPSVVDPAQLGRTGRILLGWLEPSAARGPLSR